MEIEIKKKVDEEVDELPGDEKEVVASSRERELELELAEARGELKARKSISTTSNTNGQMTLEQTKQLVFTDMNNLSDEDFRKKYNQTKHAATMTITDADNRTTKAEAKRDRAEALAVSEIGAEIGSDFYKFKDQILENAADLSEEARQDPAKLKRFLKAQYVTMTKEIERKPVGDGSRRKVAADFEKPTLVVAKDEGKEELDTEIPDEIPKDSDISSRKLAQYMGLNGVSEKERKSLAEKEMIYVDMDLGGGYRFGDPKRGFEKVKVA